MNKWFPTINQISVNNGKPITLVGYIRSVWIGFTAPILNFPISLIGAMIHLTIWNIIKWFFVAFMVIVVWGPLLGVFGALDSENK